MMYFGKLKLALVAIACLIVAIEGIGWQRGSDNATAAPVPYEVKDEGLLWLYSTKSGKLTAYTPDGTMKTELNLKDSDHFLGFTPDGTKIAFAGKGGKLAAAEETEGLTLHLRSVNDRPEGVDTGFAIQPDDNFVWSQDCTEVVRVRFSEESNVLFNLLTKKEREIALPKGYHVYSWAKDGKSWRVMKDTGGEDPKSPRNCWLSVQIDGGKSTPLADDKYSLVGLKESPDGKTLLGCYREHPHVEPARCGWATADAISGKVTSAFNFEKLGHGFSIAVLGWSPNGGRVACLRYDFADAGMKTRFATLFVSDPDRKNEKQILKIEIDDDHIGFYGWFPTKPKATVSKPR